MLTTSFEVFKEKYLPSFMLAQKYALPLIVSAMAIAFLTFFEPERLQDKKTLTAMRILMSLVFLIFTYYITSLNIKEYSEGTLVVFVIQWFAILFETVYFSAMKINTKSRCVSGFW